jgi:RimJ/RimL family protein N-acetyltransferase
VSGLLGVIGLHARDPTMREVGYWMAPWARGRGIMTDAVRLACGWGFDELGLGRIEWWANVGNQASRRVAEKAGFTMEGTVRARLLHRGVRVDGWGAGLLPGEITGRATGAPL